MAFAKDYRTDVLELHEINGVVMSLTTKTRICGLIANDHSILVQALNFDGVPRAGAILASPVGLDLPSNRLINLVVARRTAKVINEDNGTVDVIIEYEHFMDSFNQDMTIAGTPDGSTTDGGLPSGSVFGGGNVMVFGKMRSSVQQTKTNFFLDKRFRDIPDWDAYQFYQQGSLVWYQGFIWRAKEFIAQNLVVEFRIANPPPPGRIVTVIAVPPVPGILGGIGGPAGPAVPLPAPGAETTTREVWELVNSGQGFYDTNAIDDDAQARVVPNRTSRRTIVVGHLMPPDDPDAALRNKIVYQTGEISVMQSHDCYQVKGIVRTAAPWLIKKRVQNSINYNPWLDGGPYEWMCTEVGWEVLQPNVLYRMNFEFQRNPDGWRPTAIFNDSRRGKPPANLELGFGVRTIHYHPELDFDEFFLTSFEGWASSPLGD